MQSPTPPLDERTELVELITSRTFSELVSRKSSLSKKERQEKWKELFDICVSRNHKWTVGKDPVFLVRTKWPGIKRDALSRRSGSYTKADLMILELLRANDPEFEQTGTSDLTFQEESVANEEDAGVNVIHPKLEFLAEKMPPTDGMEWAISSGQKAVSDAESSVNAAANFLMNALTDSFNHNATNLNVNYDKQRNVNPNSDADSALMQRQQNASGHLKRTREQMLCQNKRNVAVDSHQLTSPYSSAQDRTQSVMNFDAHLKNVDNFLSDSGDVYGKVDAFSNPLTAADVGAVATDDRDIKRMKLRLFEAQLALIDSQIEANRSMVALNHVKINAMARTSVITRQEMLRTMSNT